MKTKIITLLIASLSLVSCDLLNQLNTAANRGGGNNPNNKNQGGQNNNGNSSPTSIKKTAIKSTAPITLNLSINNSVQKSINKDLNGFSTGFAFKNDMESHPEVVKLTKAIDSRVLRFPGGTLAQYYHMTGNGYGMKQEEAKVLRGMLMAHGWGQQEDENYVENFIRLCNNSAENVKVLAVANMLTGEPHEIVDLVKYLKQRGVNVVGIELGNELYFDQYRKYLPTVHDYIKRSKIFVKEIKKTYPNIPIAICTGNVINWYSTEAPVRRSFDKWNKPLINQNFYDAVVAHVYFAQKSTKNVCYNLSGDNLEEVYSCYKDLLSPTKYNYIEKLYKAYENLFGRGVKIWFNEWNVYKATKHLTNSILHGAFIAEVYLGLIDVNIKYNNPFQYTLIHNYLDQGPVMGTMYWNKYNIPNLNGNNKIVASTQYYAMLFLSELLKKDIKRTNSNLQYKEGLDNGDVVVRTFYSPKTNKNFIFYINRSGRSVTLNAIGKASANIRKRGIAGNHLHSSAGFGAMTRNHKEQYEQCNLLDTKVQNFVIDPYGYGYFEY